MQDDYDPKQYYILIGDNASGSTGEDAEMAKGFGIFGNNFLNNMYMRVRDTSFLHSPLHIFRCSSHVVVLLSFGTGPSVIVHAACGGQRIALCTS